MDFYESLDYEERTAREAVRSAVVLAKIRYDEQLAPFVKNDKVRLASLLVRTEIERIVKECSEEVGADPVTVASRFEQVLADVVLPVTQPERVNVEDLPDSYPPGGFSDEKPEAEATTDVKDNGAVLVDEITEPDKRIEVNACFRCEENAAEENSPLCVECEAGILLQAGVTPDFLALKTAFDWGNLGPNEIAALVHSAGYILDQGWNVLDKSGHFIAKAADWVRNYNPQSNAPMGGVGCQYNHAGDLTNNNPGCLLHNPNYVQHGGSVKVALPYQAVPSSPQQQSPVGPQQPLTPLNPNSPYQCNVCGFTGTFHDVQAHLNAATDTAHMQAKQQQGQQAQQGQQGVTPQYGQQPTAAADRYFDDVHKDDYTEPRMQVNPSSHFEHVVQVMANRAAARGLSTPTDDRVNAVASAYGLDPDQVRSSLFITAKFGDYGYTNGQPGEQQPPEGYVPLNLDGTQGQESTHEVAVPVTTAVRKAAGDLGMDEHTVYSSVKDSMGDGLSDEYHVAAKGMYTMYVPSTLLDQATNHPQPQVPDQQAAPQGPPNPSGAPGSPVESMQPIQPMQPSSHFLGKPLSQEYLDWLLARDEQIQTKRMARRGYLKLR